MNFFKTTVNRVNRKNEIEKVTEIEKNLFPSLSPSFLRLDKTGFTLTEMLVVLVIMSILITMAYSTIRTSNEQIACKEIYSSLQLAKMQAVSTNVIVPFDIDDAVQSVENVSWDEEVAYLTSAPTVLPDSLAFPGGGMGFGSGPGPSDMIYFSQKGMAIDAGGGARSGGVYIFDKKNPNRICAVTILPTGIIRMWTSSDGGASWN